MDGKIYIDSRIANTQEWLGKDVTKYQAIIDLYMMADKSGDKAVVRTSENELSKRWGWSRRRLRGFLADLERKSIAEISRQRGGDTTLGTMLGTKLTLENTRFFGISGTTLGTMLGTMLDTTENKTAPPPLEEVKTYCAERSSPIDAEVFYDYYATRGWKIGKEKTPIEDWKACLRSWERNKKETTARNKSEQKPTEDTRPPIERLPKEFAEQLVARDLVDEEGHIYYACLSEEEIKEVRKYGLLT